MLRLILLCKLFTLVVIFAFVVKPQMINEYEGYMSTGSQDRNAFYALRSCHQILHGDGGEFFSPDYLCSYPALWCNWTIQVPHGKRVRLYLEDLTPAHICHLKTDQIHLDEFPLSAGEGRILERCWGSVLYASVSNTVHVVQLIDPNPTQPHRGFYGMYQAFGSPKSPADKSVEDLSEAVSLEKEDQVLSTQKPLTEENIDDAYNKPNDKNTIGYWPEVPTTASWERHSGEIRRTRDKSENPKEAAYGALSNSDLAVLELVVEQTTKPNWTTFDPYDQPSSAPDSATPTESKNKVEPVLTQVASITATTSQKEAKQFVLTSTRAPDEPAGTLHTAPEGVSTEIKPNSTRKNKKYHRIKEKSFPVLNFRNATEPPHFPGGLLLEVTVEVGLDQGRKDNWEHIRNSYRTAVETMIQKVLENFNPNSVSSKRSKRLNAGALFIVWVQFGEDDEGFTHRLLQSILLELKGKSLNPSDTKSHGIITSVSVEDIDECETHLVKCDGHAVCVNEFGSYSCSCPYGYRPSLGGAICAEPEIDDCSRTPLGSLLYVLCFLLCFLIALLLVSLCAWYRRYHRGSFLLRRRYSSTRYSAKDINNNPNLGGGDSGVESSSRKRLPPPPPPPCRLTGGTPDLALLRFSSLVSPEGKMQTDQF